MADDAGMRNVIKHLECSICLELFENPRELACRHIFCKCCLDEIVKFNEDGSGKINCPHGCNDNTILGADKTTNDIGSSIYVNSMIDELKVNKK